MHHLKITIEVKRGYQTFIILRFSTRVPYFYENSWLLTEP